MEYEFKDEIINRRRGMIKFFCYVFTFYYSVFGIVKCIIIY